MRALVVYESMFGNTEAIARAVADGLGHALTGGAVDVVEVSSAPAVAPPDVEMLVVGGPTHAHGMTNQQTRADAAGRAGERLVSRRRGIREWLDALPRTSGTVVAAVFDTRIKGPELLWGSAAKRAARQLESRGYRLALPPESFLVDGPTGPVFDRIARGELERARSWGERLGGSASLRPLEVETPKHD